MRKEMGANLRQTLQGLCFNTSWNYAVFWKLKHGTRMNLAWEDGCYEYMKTSVVSNVSAYMPQGFPLSGTGCGQEGVYAEDGFSVDQIGRAVAQMSCQVFIFGEGTIGNVAFTDKHQWIFGDKNCASELNSVGPVYGRALLEYPIEWQDQFAAGIKTIAVIAVMPHGVVQLGSTQMIMEDLNFVNHVKEQVKEDLDFVNRVKAEFGIFQNIPKTLLPNCSLDGRSGKIEGSPFQKMSIPPTSLGNATSLAVTNAIASEVKSNASVLKISNSDILDQFISSTNLVEKNKSLPSCTLALPSMGSDGASTGAVNCPSSFQQNNTPLDNLLAHIADKKGSESGNAIILPSTSGVYPFEGQMPTNIALPDRQQTLNMGSSNIFLEQSQFQGKMALDFQEDCILNSICGSAKSINAERLGQDGFNRTHKHDRLQETALDVQPSVPLFQDNVGQSGYSSLAQRLLARNINKTKKETAMPVVKTDIENIPYTSPLLSSANIGMAMSDPRQSCNVQWSASAGCHITKMLDNLSNGLANSLGYQDISASNTVGLDHLSWQKEVIEKNIPEHLSDNGIYGMNPVKEISKNTMADLSKYSTILADFDNPDAIEFGSSDNSRNLPFKGQNKTRHAISCIPSSVELLEALRPTFKAPDNGVWDEMLLYRGISGKNLGNQNFGVSPCSDYHSEEEVNKKSDLSTMTASEGWFLPETKSEDLLDAVVANRSMRTNQGGDDNMSCKTTFSSTTNLTPLYCSSAKSDNCSAAHLSASEKEQSMALDNSKHRESLDLGDCTNTSFSSMFHEDIGVKMFANESSTSSMPKSLVNEAQCENHGFAQTKRPGEPIKGNRKRAKPGESSRPRPKDRQQIQDRLKELREIIPNGAKCSIDTLLERTIKHMHFLQSVTKYADKLKLTGKSKVLDEEVALLANTMEGGSSWAFELGSQAVGCPIIVENLNQARQMLVEMLCEERGLFLEIADSIRNLGLTILKGIMEARNDKIWARFVVEADRDVHRVEILWSLIQVLQPNTKGSSTSNHSSLLKSQVTENVSQTFDTFQLSPMVCGP